jgi:hypothetical protein
LILKRGAKLFNRSPKSLIPVILMHDALNGFSVFIGRELIPPLLEEDGFVLVYVMMMFLVGSFPAWPVYRSQRRPGQEPE